MKKENRFFLSNNRILSPFIFVYFLSLLFINTSSLFSMNGEGETPQNVLLITIDTLRADRLSCYGNVSFKTPNIDSLAKKGILYTRAFAHNSLTLPSHTNIMLGTTPNYHGVQDNSNFIVKNNFLTLAEHLKKSGYSTGAFIGGLPLDSIFGLDQGFDVYDDNFAPEDSSENSSAERKAEVVIEKALQWMKNQTSHWFIWIHLYDPHYTYEPPEPFFSRFKTTPYDGEVAYIDFSLGRLFAHMEKNNLFGNTLVVFTSDHGESLGDHGEDTHGILAYNSTIWIPLIISIPKIKSKTIDQSVSHIDIFPTVCDVLGLEKPQPLQGLSLLPTTKGKKIPERVIYFESLQPYYTLGWAPLKGYISKRGKFFDSPIPELYDLASDFDEKNNMAGSTNLENYKRTLEQLILQQSIPENNNARKRIDNATLSKLKGLGYLGNPMSIQKETYSAADDIKTLLPKYNRVVKAFKLKDTGQIQEGILKLKAVIQETQSVDFAYSYLAQLYKESHQIENALTVLREGLIRYPDSSEILNVYSEYLIDLGKNDELIALLGAGNLKQMERDPKFFNRLGIAYMNKNDLEKGINAFEMALAIESEYVDALFNLGSIYLTMSLKNNNKDILQKSTTYLLKVIELNPNHWKALNSMGTVYLQLGQTTKAIDYWEKTLELNPRSERTHYYLGLVYFSENKVKESLIHLTLYKSNYYQFLSDEEKMKLDTLIQLVKSKF
ncbi:MAG: sulfatase-like hydrolase/transferase [Candidatus Aminicenantes bacterium]|nr:sulfatase-like hydrolase/transferase [Candidatus Aminicenantes bacterium]